MAQTKLIINQHTDGTWLVWDQLETATSRVHTFNDRDEVLAHLTRILNPDTDRAGRGPAVS